MKTADEKAGQNQAGLSVDQQPNPQASVQSLGDKPMRLRSPVPPAVADALRAAGLDSDALVLSIASDINVLGEYSRQWLTATAKQVLVHDEKDPLVDPIIVHLDKVKEFRTIAGVGSGLLRAMVEGVWVDLIRYSNGQKYWFNRACKRLEQLRQGLVVVLEEEDEHDPCRCRSCGLMLSFAGDTCPRCIHGGAAMARLMDLLKPYWILAAAMMALLVVGLCLDMIGPQLTRYLVDNVLTDSSKAKPSRLFGLLDNMHDPLKALLMIVGALAVVAVLRQTINAINGRISSRVGTLITYDVRTRLVEHLERLSINYYDRQPTGSLVGRVAYDTGAIQDLMSQLTAGFFMQLMLVILSGIMMFSMEPTLAFWTLVPAPIVLASTIIFYRYVYPHYYRLWDRSTRQAGLLSGMLSGIRVVKAFAQEERELDRFREVAGQLRDARMVVDFRSATFYPIMGLVFSSGGWIIWYIGGKNVLGGVMTLGELMAFFGYLGMFYGPLSQLTHLTSWLTNFTTQVHRIFEVLDTPIAITDTAKPVALTQMKGDLEFQNVVFGYSRQSPVLKGVSFKIAAGQKIGVVGRSGSGKTTMINLFCRFYDVDEGQVLIDGVDIRKVRRQDLHRQVGLVLQEPFLFRGTIWDNLVYGKRDASVEEVLGACKAANCHDFIMQRYHAYDTWVGEAGAGMSGGEKQRTSIARALLCDPRVLILDEATSSIDSESELSIQQALAHLCHGRTTIAIAHRLSTLRNSDRILVIEEGRLVEQGTHPELMRRAGKYAKLVQIQNASSTPVSIDELERREKEKAVDLGAPPPKLTRDEVTGLTPINAHEVRWLTPENARIHLGNHNALHVTVLNEAIYHGAYAFRCLPVRYRTRYISLRYLNSDDREQEIGLIRDLEEWPEEAQKLVRESLLRRYFVHTISSIDAVKEFQGFLSFHVQTDLGPQQFILRYTGGAASDFGTGGKILIDVEGNRFLIPDLAQLPRRDRQLFERYIYW